MLIFVRIGDVVNQWRRTTLNLESLPALVGANLTSYLKVPFTYCFSEAIVPRPVDWGSHIGIYPTSSCYFPH